MSKNTLLTNKTKKRKRYDDTDSESESESESGSKSESKSKSRPLKSKPKIKIKIKKDEEDCDKQEKEKDKDKDKDVEKNDDEKNDTEKKDVEMKDIEMKHVVNDQNPQIVIHRNFRTSKIVEPFTLPQDDVIEFKHVFEPKGEAKQHNDLMHEIRKTHLVKQFNSPKKDNLKMVTAEEKKEEKKEKKETLGENLKLENIAQIKLEPKDPEEHIQIKKEPIERMDTSDEKGNKDGNLVKKENKQWKLKRSELNVIADFKLPSGFEPPKFDDKLNIDKDLNLYITDIDSTTELKGKFEDRRDPSKLVPVLRAFCLTEDSQPVLLHIHGYKPYFYARIPFEIMDDIPPIVKPKQEEETKVNDETKVKEEKVKIETNTSTKQLTPEQKDAYNFKVQMNNLQTKNRLCDELRMTIETALAQKFGNKIPKPYVISVEVEHETSLLYYQFGRKADYFKITLSAPRLVNTARNLLAGMSNDNSPPFLGNAVHFFGKKRLFDVFDCNFAFNLKFLCDVDGQGCGYLTIPKGKYAQRARKDCKHLYEVEVDGNVKDMVFHDSTKEAKWAHIPRQRLLSFDIECAGQKGRFPMADQDPIILISMIQHVTKSIGIKPSLYDEFKKKEDEELKKKQHDKEKAEKDEKTRKEKDEKLGKEEKTEKKNEGKEEKFESKKGGPVGEAIKIPVPKADGGGGASKKEYTIEVAKCNISLRSCDPLDGVETVCFDNDELKMLQYFFMFLREHKYQLLTGYNISNFDIPFILNRAIELQIPNYNYWTQILEPVTAEKKTFNSKATGNQARMDITLPGAIPYDVYRIIVADHKLDSYTLNHVAFHFLKQTKDDIHHSQITPLFEKDSASRKKLAKYCIQDGVLPLKLIVKLTKLVNHIGMARVTGVTINILNNRGQGPKTQSLLQRISRREQFVMPFSYRNHGGEGDEGGKKFEGATVQDAKREFYGDTPVATLDFASLYPSLMQAHNLSYDTLVRPEDVCKIPSEDMTRIENAGEVLYFVKAHVRKGMLCIILERLLSARKAAKDRLAKAEAEKDYDSIPIHDGVQLALKISANSVFGFTAGFIFPLAAIGASVTYFGRMSIQQVVDMIVNRFRAGMTISCEVMIKNKDGTKEKKKLIMTLEFTITVVYGDTDSVMLKCGPVTVAIAMTIATIAATNATDLFLRPIELTFEKVYFPNLINPKKRNAGLLYEPGKPDAPKKLDSKGHEGIRRENCWFLRNSMFMLLDILMVKKDIPAALECAKQRHLDLLAGKIPLHQLIMSKSIAKSEYTTKPLQVYLAERIEKRAPGTGPKVGSRVAYIMTGGAKKAKMYDKIEECEFAVDHNIKPDYKMYEEKQYVKAISKLLFYPWLYLCEKQGKPVTRQRLAGFPMKPGQDNDYYTYCSSLEQKKLNVLMELQMKHLFVGRHTATITKASTLQGTLGSFLVQADTCLGCKALIRVNDHIKAESQYKLKNKSITMPFKFESKSKTIAISASASSSKSNSGFASKSVFKPASTSISASHQNRRPLIEKILCSVCLIKERENPTVYLKEIDKLRELEQETCRIWARCQSCVEDHFNSSESLCSNNECSSYHLRNILLKDLNTQQKRMELF